MKTLTHKVWFLILSSALAAGLVYGQQNGANRSDLRGGAAQNNLAREVRGRKCFYILHFSLEQIWEGAECPFSRTLWIFRRQTTSPLAAAPSGLWSSGIA